jgi:alkaline phosphatase D
MELTARLAPGLCLLIFGTAQTISPAPAAAGPLRALPILSHGPLVGAVTESSAIVWLRTDGPAAVQVHYGPSAAEELSFESGVFETSAKRDYTTRVPLQDLVPSTDYSYNILVNGQAQLTAPYPHFKTFPPPGANVAFKFGILNDFGSNGSSQPALPAPVPTFDSLDAERPDFVIIGGDFGHHNYDTLADKRRQFQELYSLDSPAAPLDSFVSKVLRAYPLAHMWDDHDYGLNNGDKNYRFKRRSRRVLEEYFPVYALGPQGDWQSFRYGNADFFMLDSRSERDPYRDPDNAAKSMLDGSARGAAGQLEWLKRGLVESTARWKFIISPVVFNRTHTKPDSWYNFQTERTRLVLFVRRHAISGVIFISGDSHIGALDNG